MTEIEKLISIAKADIGYSESPPNSNMTKYGEAYGTNGVPYCVQAQWYWFGKANLSKYFYGGGKTASCTELMNYHKKLGQVVTSGYQRGDLILYQFDSDAPPDHIGLCTGSTSTTITTIEGNTSVSSDDNGGSVMERTRRLGLVLCGIRWCKDISYSPSKVDVKKIQTYLNAEYSAGLVVDGIAGVKTNGAIVKALQTELNARYDVRLDVDGEFGEKTKAAVHSLNVASKGKIQYVVQMALILKQESLVLDGVFGTKTLAAVKAFQKANKLTVDGVVGKNTMEILMK